MIAAVSNTEALLALLILVVVGAMFVLMFVDLDALVCELREDGTEVGVDRSSSDGAFLAMPLRSGMTATVDADTFPFDQDSA